MKLSLLILLLAMMSSCEDFNSNSADELKYSNEVQQEEANNPDPNFAAAQKVIETRCISCHSGFHNNWAGFTNNDAWINSGLVQRGDPDNSRLIQMTINSGQSGANMPLGGGAIPDAEFQTLKTWIRDMP